LVWRIHRQPRLDRVVAVVAVDQVVDRVEAPVFGDGTPLAREPGRVAGRLLGDLATALLERLLVLLGEGLDLAQPEHERQGAAERCDTALDRRREAPPQAPR